MAIPLLAFRHVIWIVPRLVFGKSNILFNFIEMRGRREWQLLPNPFAMRLGNSSGRSFTCSTIHGANAGTDILTSLWRKRSFCEVPHGTLARGVNGTGRGPGRG
jgi:hypothetical protein